jgi:hypothetical protein
LFLTRFEEAGSAEGRGGEGDGTHHLKLYARVSQSTPASTQSGRDSPSVRLRVRSGSKYSDSELHLVTSSMSLWVVGVIAKHRQAGWTCKSGF